MRWSIVVALLSGTLGICLAQEKSKPKPSLEETITWMQSFSQVHGEMIVGDKTVQTNKLSSAEGCKVLVDHHFEGPKTEDQVKSIQESFSLADIDPDSVKIEDDHFKNAETHEVHFERTDSARKIEAAVERGNGKRETWHSANVVMLFDSHEAANRFATALQHAIQLCNGTPAPF